MHSALGSASGCASFCKPNHRTRGSHRTAYRRALIVRAEYATLSAQQQTVLRPVAKSVRAFAPATIANLGPGFDWLGCAVEVPVSTDTASHASPCMLQPVLFHTLCCLYIETILLSLDAVHTTAACQHQPTSLYCLTCCTHISPSKTAVTAECGHVLRRARGILSQQNLCLTCHLER